MRTILLASLVLTISAGCSLVLDDKVGGFTHDTQPDMTLNLIAFEAHEFQRTEVLLVNDEGLVQGHAVLDPLPSPDFTVTLANAVEPTIRRVDFWSDLDENGVLTTPTPDPAMPEDLIFHDHMWRIQLDEFGRADFSHNINFRNIVADNPARFVARPLTLSLSGAEAHEGQEAELFVWLANQDRQVGYYFLGAITGGVIDITLEGVIDDGTVYAVELAIAGGESQCVEVLGGATGASFIGTLDDLGPCE